MLSVFPPLFLREERKISEKERRKSFFSPSVKRCRGVQLSGTVGIVPFFKVQTRVPGSPSDLFFYVKEGMWIGRGPPPPPFRHYKSGPFTLAWAEAERPALFCQIQPRLSAPLTLAPPPTVLGTAPFPLWRYCRLLLFPFFFLERVVFAMNSEIFDRFWASPCQYSRKTRGTFLNIGQSASTKPSPEHWQAASDFEVLLPQCQRTGVSFSFSGYMIFRLATFFLGEETIRSHGDPALPFRDCKSVFFPQRAPSAKIHRGNSFS